MLLRTGHTKNSLCLNCCLGKYKIYKAIEVFPKAAGISNECIEEGILADFLRENRAEAIKVSIYEYDEELHFKTLRDEGYESGYAEGHESGFTEGHEAGLEQGESRLNKLYAILIESDRLDDLKHATQDRAYQEQLMLELLPGEIQNI